jgi:winged helix-turn-helix protein
MALGERYGPAREGGYGDPKRVVRGQSYHPAHVSRVVRDLGLSLQKPMRRANQRDEEAIRHWKEQRWPQLKKGP